MKDTQTPQNFEMEEGERRGSLAGRRRLAARVLIQDKPEEGRGVGLQDVQVEDAGPEEERGRGNV